MAAVSSSNSFKLPQQETRGISILKFFLCFLYLMSYFLLPIKHLCFSDGGKRKKKDTLCICQVYNSTYNTELQMQVLGFIPCVGALSYCYINVIIIYFYIPALYTLHKNRAPSKNFKISVIHFKSYEAQKFSISIFCIINVIICHHFLWRNIQV